MNAPANVQECSTQPRSRPALECLDIRPDLREHMYEALERAILYAEHAMSYLTIADDRALGYSMRHVINNVTAASSQWMALREETTKLAVEKHEAEIGADQKLNLPTEQET